MHQPLPALLHLLAREAAHKVLVDTTEGVALDVDGFKQLHQFDEHLLLDARVGVRQHVLEVGVVILDRLHGVIECRGLRLREEQQAGRSELRAADR
jgi:hypothetical protein